jgi:hypothetical protein
LSALFCIFKFTQMKQVLRYLLYGSFLLFVHSLTTTPQTGLILQTKFNGATASGKISILNDGTDCTIDSLTISGKQIFSQFLLVGVNAADFVLGDAPALPYNLKAGNTITVTVGFKPTSSAGPKSASLDFQASTGPVSASLRGLAINGDDEGSLQWIINTYGFTTQVGDDKPGDSSINSLPAQQTAPLIGEEISAQQFVKSGQGNKTFKINSFICQSKYTFSAWLFLDQRMVSTL